MLNLWKKVKAKDQSNKNHRKHKNQIMMLF